MDYSELQKKHFAALRSKYQVGLLKDIDLDTTLYLILRKSELGIKITDSEIDWLANNRLFKTIEFISLQEYQAGELKRLEAEFYDLASKYKIPQELDLPVNHSIYSILWRIDAGDSIKDSEVHLLNNQGLSETATLIQDILNFKKLKSSCKATQHIGNFPEEPLYSILKKLDSIGGLSQDEENWLLDNDFEETLHIYWNQEEERKSVEEFSDLKKKYGLDSLSNESISKFLFPILRKIDQGQVLIKSERNWLQGQKLNSLLEIDQHHSEIQFFKNLKDKYKAHQYQDEEPVGKLFTILQNIDSDLEINASDIQWLEEKELLDTAKIARAFHFRILKRKYQIVGNLSVDPFYEIMLKLERGERLDLKQVVQLMEENQLSRHGKIAIAHYRLEAMFCDQEYKRTGNLWNLPSASRNWRKANEPKNALDSTSKVNWQKIREPDLKSALWVTRGAAFRDLNQLQDAEQCAAEAMDCQPESHQPYTLMGAIHYDRGEYAEGDQWFELAVERGANDTDDEIERIVRMTKDKAKRREVAEYLLNKDPIRYGWANAYLK